MDLQPNMELYASRFETRRYLAMLGGTTEFSKWEGITLAPEIGNPTQPPLVAVSMSTSLAMNDFSGSAALGCQRHSALQCTKFLLPSIFKQLTCLRVFPNN